jgi:hypothetical protein
MHTILQQQFYSAQKLLQFIPERTYGAQIFPGFDALAIDY